MVGENTLEVLAAGRRQPHPYRLGRTTVQERYAVGGRRVLGVMGEHEERPVPGATVCASGVREVVPTCAAPKHGAGGLQVLLDEPRTDREPGHPVHLVVRPCHESV